MRSLMLLLALAGAALPLQPAFGQQAYTTRIETRPYYGAIVTIEHGVRVTRPLPPTQHLIINPNGTPLVLGGTGAILVGPPAAAPEPDDE